MARTCKEYSVADFTEVAHYQTNAYPTAAAFSPDGKYVAAGMDGVYDNDVVLAEEGYGDNVYAVDYTDYQTPGPITPAHGLAFSADGKTLYALSFDDTVSPHVVALYVLPGASAPIVTPPPPVVVPPVVAPPVVSNPHGWRRQADRP